MRLSVLQHVPFEGPGAIADWAEARAHVLAPSRLYAGEALPDPDAFDALLVLGGPMGVHDHDAHPWLAAEQRFIADCVSRGTPLIGICLGAQLMALALGAEVRRNRHREIGWAPICLTEAGRASALFEGAPDCFEVLHWHGDTFELPRGAVQLARSAGCEQQIFLHENRVLGLQCHLEATPETARALVAHSGDDLQDGGPHVQEAAAILAHNARREADLRVRLFRLLDAFFAAARA